MRRSDEEVAMTSTHPAPAPIGHPARKRLVPAGIVIVSALFVAGGAKVAFELGSTMMLSIASVGAWMMLCLGLAYAGVRLRAGVGGALLVGFGIGAFLVLLFGGMRMLA
ncbi:hypothetical protein [Amycolatopsis sp. NPDC051716]|uniref:hypothetical protein n=1 Tax=Amycolatopsis sp. NPDC051716 TaxID=3155804 RepID=UPI00341FC0F0